jgi:outer membrane protein assembly factor BamB
MRVHAIRLASIGICGLVLACLAQVHASEWTSWRGPSYDGVSAETGLVSSWSPQGENLIWKAEFIGRSTPVVVDGRACFIGRVGDGIDQQERVACFDAGDGTKRWEHRFNVYNTTVPFNRVGWASLAADPQTGNLYAHGVAGQLIAYDREGKILWSRFLAEEVGRLSGYGGRTQTPLIDGDQLLLSFVSSGWGKHAAPRHRYFSFDKRTGDILWVSTPGNFPADMNTQSVPVIARIQGRRLLVSGNADGWIYALDVASGEKIWSFQLSRRGINSSVLVVGDRVFASHSEENIDDAVMGRVVCIDGTGRGNVTESHEVWRINELAVGFPSPTYHDGRLYVVDNSANLMSISADTGKVVWEYSIGTVGKGSPVYADGKLYVTEVNGRFHILEPSKDSVRSLDMDELTVPDGRYAEIYGSPAIAYGRIYFATEGGVYCLGDSSKKFEGSSSRNKTKGGKSKAKGDPVRIQIVPTEVLTRPEDPVQFELRAFDAEGRLLKTKPQWELNGLAGSIDGGKFAPAAEFQAGEVSAKVGALEARARVRVVPDLPWSEDFEKFEPGKVPGHWISAAKKYEVQERDGEKVLVKLFRPRGLLRNALYMGPSTLINYTIAADVQGGQKGRRRTDAGLINSGYTLDLMGNHQRIQVRSWPSTERMAQQVDFPWEMGKWYRMKLRVEVTDKEAVVQGKVWPRGDSEPSSWNITVKDPHPIQGGSPGLLGYSPADILYDNIEVRVND